MSTETAPVRPRREPTPLFGTPKKRGSLLKFLLICVPLWLSFKFFNGPYAELVHDYLANITYIIVWALLVQLALPRLNERLLLIGLLVVMSVIELIIWQAPAVAEAITFNVGEYAILGGNYSYNTIPYYGVGAFIGFFILRACR